MAFSFTSLGAGFGNSFVEGAKWTFSNVVVPLGVNVGTPLLMGAIMGNDKPRQSQAVQNPVRDSAPGTINVVAPNQDGLSSTNTLIIGAAALVAVVVLMKKK